MPGGLIATHLHLPIVAVSSRGGLVWLGHGYRLENQAPNDPRHVLIVDDSAAHGFEMQASAKIIQDAYPQARVTRAAVYAHPMGTRNLDICFAIYPGSHYLSWNWINAGHGERIGLDFDGILTEEWYEGRDDRTAKPLYLPRRRTVPLIVTARIEARRADSEAWLATYRIQFDRLIMRDFEPANWNEDIGQWKGEIYRDSFCNFFAESDAEQAVIINQVSRKPVICPNLGRVLPPI